MFSSVKILHISEYCHVGSIGGTGRYISFQNEIIKYLYYRFEY